MQAYAEIRRRNPKPFGEHWEGVGCYVADGVWADPEYIGMPGQAECFGQAIQTRRKTRETRENRDLRLKVC